MENEYNNKKICDAFPPLSSLLCIEDRILLQMLAAARLAQHSEKRGYTTVLFGWESFIREFTLDVEVSQFHIFKKRCLLIRIGSWDKALHPPKKPAEIWSASLQGSIKLPKLRISSLVKGFAVKVGEIAAIEHTVVEPESDCESESSAEDIITESISLEITLESDSQGIES